jgi:hypothetical protein
MENALSERSASKGLFAPLRLATYLGELRLGRPATQAKAAPPKHREGGTPAEPVIDRHLALE